MDRTLIERIITAGTLAPSGSNSQPWRFEVRGDTIDVFGYPERDHLLLNFRSRGTWMAHGALIENMAVAAHAAGYRALVQIFLEGASPVHVACISLEPAPQGEESLAAAIPLRTTNRKPYAAVPLSAEARKEFEAAGDATPGVTVRHIDDQNKMDDVGRAVAVNEIVMLENEELHKLFFEEIVWTAAEERTRGKGLYLPTMELPPPARVALKNLFRHWPVMRIANALGLARGIAAGNARHYAAAAAMGMIVVPDSDKAFIAAGRAMERLWLTAIHRGLSFQIITGVFFLEMRFRAGETKGFDARHVERIHDAYRRVADTFGLPAFATASAGDPPGVIAAVFRVGEGGNPSARSMKRPPEIAWK